MLRAAAKVVLNSALSVMPSAARSGFKRYHELRYWRGVTRPIRHDRSKLEHERSHYEQFFTTFFGLAKADYAGKRLLDIGCGPCGSLEWASEATERVGLDPLAEDYKKLVGDTHKMTYSAAPSEAIPYPDGHFDSVSTFNSLDHVDDVEATIAEIKRVTAPSGRVLLIVEIGHLPTEFAVVSVKTFGVRADHNVYGSMLDAIPYIPGKPGILAARLERKA